MVFKASRNMVGVDNLPKCFNKKDCDCFDTLFIKPLHYNSNDVLQYTSFNLQEITKYIEIIQAHELLDQYLNIQQHTHITASEIDKATEQFLLSVKKLQTELLKQAHKGSLYCKYFNEEMSVNDLIDFYENLGGLNSKSLRLFNKPTSALPTKYLLDVLDMHRCCLYIFDQFYTLIHFGRTIYRKTNPNINIHGFEFRHNMD